jgi:AraC-like DNA-binding protein
MSRAAPLTSSRPGRRPAPRRSAPPPGAPEPLLHLHGAGVETRRADYYHDCRRRVDGTHVTLQLTLAGEGFYATRRGRVAVPPGHAWLDLIPGPFEYGFRRGATVPYELVFVAFAGPTALRLYRDLVRQFGHVLELGTAGPVATQMLAIARANQHGTLPDRYLQSGLLYQLIMAIHSAQRLTRVNTNPRIARAVALAEAHAADADFTIAALAARLDCSREYLARQFRAATGTRPSTYLTQRRVRLAAEALRSTTDKLEVVARRAGFSGANYLCRVFRRQTGVTPAQFRARRWLAVP